MKELRYEEDTGFFYWVNPKPGRPSDRPAGSVSLQGYTCITYNGIKYHGPKLAWYIMTGVWPSSLIGYKDGDARNLAWSNLKLITHEDRLQHYRQVGEILDTAPKVPTKPVKRATFSNAEASKATEEFLKRQAESDGI